MAKGRSNKILSDPETTPSLPLDMFTEILSWLPVLSLVICKCVCREWKSVIEEPSFIKKHMNRSSIMVLYGENEDVDVDTNKFKVIRSSEGLVLQEGDQYHYRIKNPATRQVLRLPDPVKKPGYMFFNYISGSMVYKVIHLHSQGRRSTDLGCEVLTVTDDLAWRGLNIPSLTNIYGGGAKLFFCPSSDILYIIRLAEKALDDSKIICLDLVTEHFSCFEIPRRFFWDWRSVYPIMWNEKVCISSVVEDKLVLWVLESYKMKQWAERKIVIPLFFLKAIAPVNKVRPLNLRGSILYLQVNDHLILSYDIEEKKIKQCWQPAESLCFQLHSSLVQLKGMQAEERIEG